ncbi:complex I NDUFA9 subunit family protein [Ralstonia sp. SET104]|uniref:complex I NDUFA9 subunit family protein n=1 Tax=Ralstonia sp. SET104 TaxID=2448774 RepID=UPI000F579C98|nr:complex I NDUFA9 subunit family protein [Ralstonia sp. SET104]GCB04866.1 complex I NDUFA9 subunit family protein [Ralstonia sp. SET104]
MQPSNLLVFGGTGFIGSQLLSRLVTETFSAPGLPEGRVIVPTRDPESSRAHNLTLLPRVDVMDADIYADDALDALFLALTERGGEHCAVINLVGVLQDAREMPYGPNFQRVHVDLPRRIVAACRRHGVNRLLHMSALGADPAGPSMYLRSKGDGERVVMNSELDWTVFRPSVVFGPQDHFLNLFASMQRMAPFVPLACADARFQPVYVDDVAAAFINALKKPATIRHAYPLVGPRIYTLAELMRFAGRASGHPRWIVPLPEGLGRMQAALLERLPGAPISRDNLDSMRVDNVSMEPVAPELGIRPLGMEAVMLPALAGLGPDRGLRAARTRVHR